MNDLLSFFPILSELSIKAGAIIRRYYNSQLEVELKPDDSPVTQADREVEIFLRESLEKRFPDFSILGEEFGETRKSSAYRWIIDPIDGTERERVARLCGSVRLVRGLGDCYGYYLVARGLADVMIEPAALKYYDVAPLPPILEGAGGTFTTLSGDYDLSSGQGLATNRALCEEVLRVLNGD